MMQTMPYNLQGKGVVELSNLSKWKTPTNNTNFDNKFQQQQEIEQHNNTISTTPRATSSVDSEHTSTTLDTPPCHPPTSTSTTTKHALIPNDITPTLDEWDTIFPNSEGALLPWIMGESDDMGLGLGLKHLLQSGNPVIDFNGNAPGFEPMPDPNLGFGSYPSLVVNPLQTQPLPNTPTFLIPSLGYGYDLEQHVYQPQMKRQNTNTGHTVHNTGHPYVNPGGPTLHIHQQVQVQEQGIKDQLYKAGEFIQTGNFSLAQEILARLNHNHFSSLPPKPLVRAALYMKEALQSLLLAAPTTKILTPYDVVQKMGAYKAFSEVSPVTQFVNLTATQTILEAIADVDGGTIHVIDFDLGCGAQWASLIQELPLRKRGAPKLNITAVSPASNTDPFEISLVRENLIQFANDIGVSCEIHFTNLDQFENVKICEGNLEEAVVVNLPIWASSIRPSILPSILRSIKNHSPKITISFDRGFDRFDLPFPQHLLHTLESCSNFLDSIDGLRVGPDVAGRFERYFVQPRVEEAVMGRVNCPEKMPHWKTMFGSAGFSQVQMSNFAETQADYVVKRGAGRGFHVEKRHAGLVLSWQRREIMTASAWKC